MIQTHLVTPVTASPAPSPRVLTSSPLHLVLPPQLSPETDDLPLPQRLNLLGHPAVIQEICAQRLILADLQERIELLTTLVMPSAPPTPSACPTLPTVAAVAPPVPADGDHR